MEVETYGISRYNCMACGADYDHRPCPSCFPANR